MRYPGLSPLASKPLEEDYEAVRPIRGVQAVSDAYTATTRDSLILVDATDGAITVTLYTAVGNKGRIVAVKKIDDSANAVTVEGVSSQTIDGAADASLASQWDCVQLQSDGDNWFVIGGGIRGPRASASLKRGR